jgi:hypothetical protein
MKPKTLTYNQILKLFNDYNLPLSKNQCQLISMLNRKDMVKLEKYREEKAKQREKRKVKVSLITNNTA